MIHITDISMLSKLEARRRNLWDALISREKAAISGESWTN
jgi:hypothetical protein